ncbi:hypothetical protein BDR26DRAFT_857075 [Obelidium mucronatum]|nr:hypothetical protein BDR26DRAFT_857075 [Obelidium mucronatum]
MLFSSVLATVSILAAEVTAHGMMAWPIPRVLPGDPQNGYTYARAASNRNTAVHPDPDVNCSFLPKGPVFTQVLAPGPATLDYTITAWHNGGCIAYLSTDNQQTWQKIGEDPTCGVQSINPNGRGSININIPSGTYQGVIRWSYTADNGGSPTNEIFTNCADVSVAPNGSNKHLKVELMGSIVNPEWNILLPRTPWQFQSSSCPTPGATLCAGPGSSFINQCISLAAGGGWAGGSSYYQYQCPFGATCQTVNGVDACVGGAVQPTTVGTTVSTTVKPSTTTTTTTTTTTLVTTTSRTATTATKTATTTTTTTTTIPQPTTTTPKPTTTTVRTTSTKVVSSTTSTGIINGSPCSTFGAIQCVNKVQYQCAYWSGSSTTWGAWGAC